MRKIFTKRKNILIIVTIIVSLLLGVILYKTYPVIYGKLYSGNHIKLDLSIYYKGKQLEADDYKIECINPKGKNESISEEGIQYAVKGGEYGCYSFVITIFSHVMDEKDVEMETLDKTYIEHVKEEVIVELKFLNSNDWYISNSNCKIEIQNIDGLLNSKCVIDTEYNDGTSSEYSKQKQFDNGKVEFSWGN